MSRGLEEARAAHNQATPTTPEVGLREAVEAIVNSPEADMFRAAAFEHRVPQPYADNRYLHLLDDIRDALATHPSPPLPGQSGVAEVVQRVLREHSDVRRVPLPKNNADWELQRTPYEMQCTCGVEMPWGRADEQHEAHVASEVARTLGGEA